MAPTAVRLAPHSVASAAGNRRTLPLVGLGCVLLLWTLLGIVAAGVAIAGVLAGAAGLAARSKLLAIGGGAFAILGTLVFCGVVAFVVGWLVLGGPRQSTSTSVLRDEFGIDVTPSFAESLCDGSTDSHRHYTHFHLPESEIAKFRLAAAPADECVPLLRDSDAPEWWRPKPSALCYHAQPFGDAFASTEAWLVYDASTGEGFFHYVGID